MENQHLHQLLGKLRGLTKAPDGKKGETQWRAHCPCHQNDGKSHEPSLSIGHLDGWIGLTCHAGCKFEAIAIALGYSPHEMYPPGKTPSDLAKRETTAVYDYVCEQGIVRYRNCRQEWTEKGKRKKTFFQQQPDGNGKWLPNLTGVERIPYRLPELLAADPERPVVIVEGEKSTDFCRSKGLVVTCTQDKKWPQKIARHLKGHPVIIVPDADLPNKQTGEIAGNKFAKEAADSIVKVTPQVKVVELPDAGAKWGLDDWFEIGGHSVDEFIELAKSADCWGPDVELVTRVVDPARENPKPGERIYIDVADEEEHATNARVLSWLAQCGGLYAFGDSLVEVEDGQIFRLTEATLRSHITRYVDFSNAGTECPPPKWCYQAIHQAGRWKDIPKLERVVRHPLLRPDGTVMQESGYDEQTATYVWLEEEFPPIPETPTLEECRAAADRILELVSEFCFEKEARDGSIAAWLCCVLTPFARSLYDGPTAPLFVFDSNSAGTGKTLLAKVASIIATGEVVEANDYPRTNDAMSKLITSIATQDVAYAMLDNIATKLGCAALDSALTTRRYSGRDLGFSRMIKCNLNMVWCANGNNLELKDDTARRTCLIKLETEEEEPDEQEFAIEDLEECAKEHRAELLTCALTILRGFNHAGKPLPDNFPRWGSFTGWSENVRAAVVWVGMADCASTRHIVKEGLDGGRESLIQIHYAIELMTQRETLGVTAGDMIQAANSGYPMYSDVIQEAVEAFVGMPLQRISPNLLGAKLKRRLKKVVEGKRLKKQKGRANRTEYFVEKRNDIGDEIEGEPTPEKWLEWLEPKSGSNQHLTTTSVSKTLPFEDFG